MLLAKSDITVHFLACNQLYITYGTVEEGRNIPIHYKQAAKGQLFHPKPISGLTTPYRGANQPRYTA
ncbi:hypothetical protein [Snodgrassella gandavensis]|uniref:hypothetical protein n=1 Tax=Snodgrassella gandavensis TaxID=2946698 RepID=UPI001EF60A58|nr:hypothetical protein [Snodgrassella gandavensis]